MSIKKVIRNILKLNFIKILLIVGVMFHSSGIAMAISSSDKSAVFKDTIFLDYDFKCGGTGGVAQGDPACKGAKLPTINDKAAFAKAIEDYIRNNGGGNSPLAHLGNIFVDAGIQYGVNPAYIASIAKTESSFGTTGIAVGRNNAFGNRYFGAGDKNIKNSPVPVRNAGGWSAFGSWQEGIKYEAFYINNRYFSDGITTIAAITEIYCPRSECDTDKYIKSSQEEIAKIIDSAGPAIACGASAPVTNTSTGKVQAGKVYLLGDSILNRSKQALETSLNRDSWSANISAIDGRPLNGPISTIPANSNQPNGVGQIDIDAQTIKDSVAIVIELGTNPGDTSDFGNQIKLTIDKIRTINPSAPIYWVNIGSSGSTISNDPSSAKSAAMFSARNSAINTNALLKNYKVIDWARTVFPNSNPEQIQPRQPSSANLLDPDLVHPNSAGITALTDQISKAVTAGTLDASGAQDQCTTTSGVVGGAGGFDMSGDHAITYYNQGDGTWAGYPYNGGTIRSGGCAPTSMAMIIATLTGDTSVTPITIVNYVSKNTPQHMDGSGGSNQSIGQIATNWKLKATPLGKDMNAAIQTVKSGGLVLMNVKQGGPVSLSGSGHFVVIRKVDENGKLYIANPGQRADNEKAFDRAAVEGQLQGGSNPLYGITR